MGIGGAGIGLGLLRAQPFLGGIRALPGDASQLAELENRLKDHDEQILAIFDAIRALMAPAEKPKKKIGFDLKEKQAGYRKK